MKRDCAWCGKELEPVASDDADDALITHGICDDCIFTFDAQEGAPIQAYLDQLPAPVVLIDSDGCIAAANKASCTLFRKELREVKGLPGGMVFECKFARLPGGCGNTIHCSGCTIRRTVMDTLQKSRNHRNVQAYLNQQVFSKTQQLDLRISTEKIMNMVILRIDSITVTADARSESQ